MPEDDFERRTAMTIAYLVIFILSLLMVPAYIAFLKKNNDEPWLLVLFICISVVNLGYFLLSMAQTVSFALFANKIVYLGQVVIPLAMLMIIVKLCGYPMRQRLVYALIGAAVLMYAAILTTGHLDWYYTSAWIERIAGATVLYKEYGFLHPTNLVYVVTYFVGMIGVLASSLKNHKGASQKHAAAMLAIVLGNIAMWMVQKVIPWEFELLSVTYLMSAGAFLGVWFMLGDYVHKSDIQKYTRKEQERLGIQITAMSMEEKIARVLTVVSPEDPLAIREREILELILANKKRKDIALSLHLSENTVKTYTRTLYSKLGVTSREDLYSLLLKDKTE